MAGLVRLLGIAPAVAAAAVQQAMAQIAGPDLVRHQEGDCIAFAQAEPAGPRSSAAAGPGAEATRLRALQLVQRRLEAACMAGPFLPASPAAALCPAAELPVLLAAAAPRLHIALAEDAGTHQWQLTLRWPREALLAARKPMLDSTACATPQLRAEACHQALQDELAYRGAVLDAALAPAVRSLQRQPAPPGPEAEAEAALHYLLLIPRDGEAAIEAVLQALPLALSRGAMADLHGPMPPVHFHAWQVAEADEQALRTAWSLLGLPEKVDLQALRRRWHSQRAEPAPSRLAPALAAAELDASDLAALLPRARRRLIPCGGHAA